MKKNLLGFLLILPCAFAQALPFIITADPADPLPTHISTGQTLTAFYIVQNNTVSARNDNYVKHFPANTTQVIGPGLCGATFDLTEKNTLDDSCLLELAITGPTNGRKTPLMICFPGGLTCAGTEDTLDVTGSSEVPLLIRAATGGSIGTNTILESSVNDLESWSRITSGVPSQRRVYSVDCVGSGDNSLCLAGGTSSTGAFVSRSLDGGSTWTQDTLPNGTGKQVFSLDCTTSRFCVAAGGVSALTAPYLAIKNSQTGAWTDSGFTALSGTPYFRQGICSDNGSICLAVGGTSSSPYIFQSTTPNTPSSWITASIPTGTNPLTQAACTSDGLVCIASGYAALLQNLNGSIAWAAPSGFTATSGLLLNGGNSCTGTSPAQWCIAVGEDDTGGIIWQTVDSGTTWAQVPSFADTSFSAAACTGTGDDSFCIAVGSDSSHALVLAMSDDGETWSVIPNGNITGLTPIAFVQDASCSGSGSTAACVLVGVSSVSSGNTLVIQTLDGGNTWAVDTSSYISGGTLESVSVTGAS